MAFHFLFECNGIFYLFQAQQQSIPQCRLLILNCFLTRLCFKKSFKVTVYSKLHQLHHTRKLGYQRVACQNQKRLMSMAPCCLVAQQLTPAIRSSKSYIYRLLGGGVLSLQLMQRTLLKLTFYALSKVASWHLCVQDSVIWLRSHFLHNNKLLRRFCAGLSLNIAFINFH